MTFRIFNQILIKWKLVWISLMRRFQLALIVYATPWTLDSISRFRTNIQSVRSKEWMNGCYNRQISSFRIILIIFSYKIESLCHGKNGKEEYNCFVQIYYFGDVKTEFVVSAMHEQKTNSVIVSLPHCLATVIANHTYEYKVYTRYTHTVTEWNERNKWFGIRDNSFSFCKL